MSSIQRTRRQAFCNGTKDIGRFCHTSRTEFTAGHVTFIRADAVDTIGLERGDVSLVRRMQPHAHIHRGRNQHRRVGRQQQCRCQVIGVATGHLGHQIGCRRRNDDQIGGARQLYVTHLGLVGQVEQIGIDLLGRQRGGGQRRHEFLRCPGEDWCHAAACFADQPDQFQRLESSYPAANNQKNAFAVKHLVPPFLSDSVTGAQGRGQDGAICEMPRMDHRVPRLRSAANGRNPEHRQDPIAQTVRPIEQLGPYAEFSALTECPNRCAHGRCR